MIFTKAAGHRRGSASARSRPPVSRRTLWGRARARRVLAALLAGVAVWLGLSAATADPAGPSAQVVVAASDVAIGSTLTRDDVEIATLPESAVSPLASSTPGDWIAQRIVVPLRAGDVLTPTHVSLPALARGQPPGQVIAHLPLSSPALARAAAPGTRVDVLSVADGSVLASDVVILDNGGAAGAEDREGPGVFVVLDPVEAAAITAQGGATSAAAITGSAVTIVLRP
ncbi:MAG: SAF domain-containing protein [Ornithinimicrobium sp.]